MGNLGWEDPLEKVNLQASLVAQWVKNLPAMQETWVQILPSRGERNGNPLQYSCLENSIDRGATQATVHGIAKSRTKLSDFHFSVYLCFPGGACGKDST